MRLRSVVIPLVASLHFHATAASQEECQSEVAQTVQGNAVKRLPALQRSEVEKVGNDLCYYTARYEAEREAVVRFTELGEERKKLEASFCGPNPDAVGRGAACRKQKQEVDAEDEKLIRRVTELRKGEKKIRELQLRYSALRAKPLPNNAIELAPAGRKLAAIAKVKADILESLKDPDSATFRRITASADGGVICGEVNAKNSMGGYIGYRKFVNIGLEWDDFTFYEGTTHATLAEACEKQTFQR
jgi:hypothetical protein